MASVGDGFIECENLSFERSLRMKGTVLNGTATVVHLTEKNFFSIQIIHNYKVNTAKYVNKLNKHNLQWK